MKSWSSLMSLIFRLVLILILLYLLWLLISNFAIALITGFYVLGGIALSVGYLVGGRLFLLVDPLRWAQTKRAIVEDKSSRITSLRNRLSLITRTLRNILVWPAILISEVPWIIADYKKHGYRGPFITAIATDASYQVRLHMTVLFLVIALYGMSWFLDLPTFFIAGWLVVSLLYVILTLFSYFIGTVSLIELLKRQPGKPVIKFLTVTLSLYFVWVLTFYGLIYGAMPLQPDSLALVGAAILKSEPFQLWHSIEEILQNERITAQELLQLFTGLLFFLTLLDAVLHWKEFRRDDQDFREIAMSCLFLGKFNMALDWIEQVKQSTAEDLKLKASVFYGVNRLDQAAVYLKRAAIALGEPEPSDEEVLVELMYISIRVSEPILVKILTRYLNGGGSEWRVVWLVRGWVQQGNLRPVTLDSLLAELDAETSYPYLHAMSLIHNERYTDALDFLRSLNPVQPIEEITYRMMYLLAKMNPNEAREVTLSAFDNWAEENLPVFATVSTRLATDTERELALANVGLIEFYSRFLDAGYDEECEFLIREIRQSFVSDHIRRRALTIKEMVGTKLLG
ncbi:MAG: hypothetical protein WCD37_06290 [Chloroflexia bacterium]